MPEKREIENGMKEGRKKIEEKMISHGKKEICLLFSFIQEAR